MSKETDKQYCVIDHANKQRDRERLRPSRRTSHSKRPETGRRGESQAAGEAVGTALTGDD